MSKLIQFNPVLTHTQLLRALMFRFHFLDDDSKISDQSNDKGLIVQYESMFLNCPITNAIFISKDWVGGCALRYLEDYGSMKLQELVCLGGEYPSFRLRFRKE